jgi:DeoR family transcriptional regulator, fructose operon transcriptional repressor
MRANNHIQKRIKLLQLMIGRQVLRIIFMKGYPMFTEERHQAILKKIESEQRVLASELAEQFEVSLDTIRRDLAALEEKGLIKRTHGGAILTPKVRHKPGYDTVREIGEGLPYQNAIVRKAAEYISEGDTIFIGGASLHYLMLKHLPVNIHFTVVTNSVVIADELKSLDNMEVFLIGGKMRNSGMIVDALATEFVKTLRLDLYFACAAGLSAEHGLSSVTYETATFGKIVAGVARKVICLAPHEKIGYEAFARVIEARDIDIIITDQEVADSQLLKLKDLGIEVMVV